MEIILNDGKYKIILDKDQFKALRYGEEWRDLTGDNLILFLCFEIEKLRNNSYDPSAKIQK